MPCPTLNHLSAPTTPKPSAPTPCGNPHGGGCSGSALLLHPVNRKALCFIHDGVIGGHGEQRRVGLADAQAGNSGSRRSVDRAVIRAENNQLEFLGSPDFTGS